jgi:two-component system chemotaxis sensor kinase CheA
LAGIDYKELKASFVNSSLSILGKSESCVLVLESGVDKTAIDELFRGIHTIKGNSGIFELEKIPELSHAFENVLNQLRSARLMPNPDLIDLMLLGIDRLRDMISSLDTSDLVEVKDLVEKFNAYLEPQEKSTTLDAEIVESPKASSLQNENSIWSQDIKISDKVIAFAKSKKKFLSIVVFNLSAQKFDSLSLFLEKIQSVLKKSRILRKGLVLKKIAPLTNQDLPSLPYFLILLSDNNVEPILEEADIQAEFVTTVFVPDDTQSVHIQPEPEPAPSKPREEKKAANTVNPIKENTAIDTSI